MEPGEAGDPVPGQGQHQQAVRVQDRRPGVAQVAAEGRLAVGSRPARTASRRASPPWPGSGGSRPVPGTPAASAACRAVVVRTTAAGPQCVETAVGRDPVEPRPHRSSLLVPGDPAPRRRQRLLQQVLRVLHRAEDAVAVDLELTPERLDEPPERLTVTAPRQREQVLARAPVTDRGVAPPGRRDASHAGSFFPGGRRPRRVRPRPEVASDGRAAVVRRSDVRRARSGPAWSVRSAAGGMCSRKNGHHRNRKHRARPALRRARTGTSARAGPPPPGLTWPAQFPKVWFWRNRA